MNEDQITKFVNACKNAGFEVGEAKEVGVLRTRIVLSSNVMILRREYSSDHITFKLYVDGRCAAIEDFTPLIASYLLEKIKGKYQVVTVGTVSDGFWAATVPFGHICKAEEFADAIFEAFCEVYQ